MVTIYALLTFLGSTLPARSTAESAIAPVSFRNEIAPLSQRVPPVTTKKRRKAAIDWIPSPGFCARVIMEIAPIVAGKPVESELHRLLLEPNANDRMPQKADSLPAGEIALIGL